MKPKKVIISHIHSRIASLASEAIEQGLVIQCDRTTSDTYLIRCPNEFVATEYKPISAATILLSLLNRIPK